MRKGQDESALDEVIDFVRAHPNLCCDLAAYQQQIEEDEPYPYWSALRVVEKLVEGLGAERIHWGTDWPYLGVRPYGEIIRAIREAPFLDAEQVEQILGLNALQFVT
jgi:predicted TIM-barrel fold metal-dependent hydrolase